jgi:membrane protein
LKSKENKSSRKIEVLAFWQALKDYVQQGAFHHGAALAYYTLFAFIPILYLTTSIYGRIIGAKNMRVIVTDLLHDGLGLTDSESILQLVDTMSLEKPSFFLELVSIGVLLYTCSAFMLSLKRSLNEFFNVTKKNRQESNLFMELIGFRFVSVLMLAVFALVVILFYFAQVFVFSALNSWIHWHNGFIDFSFKLLQIGLTLLSNILIFSLIFKYMHDAKVSWKVALKGAILTAILLYFSQWILSYYLQHFFMLGQLGITNSIFMMLAWVHYSAQIIFLGAKFTYQVGKATGDRISS